MEDKIKKILEKLIKSGIDMNAFLKASGLSIQEKIVSVIGNGNGNGYRSRKLVKCKRKPFRY